MLFDKGDWVWYADKYGTHLLPVGVGTPCIPILPQRTTGPGLLITEEGLVHKGPTIYNILGLAWEDNSHIINYQLGNFLYLTTFKPKDLIKRFGYHNQSIIEMIRDSKITLLNPDFDHYGYCTKRRLDRDTIHFIKKWLEDQPMKAENKVKSVTATFKITSKTTGTDLDKVRQEITLENGQVITEKHQKVLARVENFKAKRLKPGDRVPIWRFIKNETHIINNKKKITRVNKWNIVGYREVPIPIVVDTPPFVYKVPRASKPVITSETVRTRQCLPNNETKTFKGKIDKKIFSGDITKTTHLKRTPYKQFDIVKHALKKHLHESYLTDEKILIRFTELRLSKYPRSKYTLRKYAAILNRMRNWNKIRKELSS